MIDPYSRYHSSHSQTSSNSPSLENENLSQDFLVTTYSFAIKKNYPDLPVYVQILGNSVQEILVSVVDRIFNVNQLKMNLLARSCVAPGSITLIANLIKALRIPPINSDCPDWLREYSHFSFLFISFSFLFLELK